MAVCFTGPPLRPWCACRPARESPTQPRGANAVPQRTSGPRCFLFPLPLAFAVLFVRAHFACAEGRLQSRPGGRVAEASGGHGRFADNRAQRLRGTCWPGVDNTLLTRPICPCKETHHLHGLLRDFASLRCSEGIGQVMQRRRECKRQYWLPAQYGCCMA